MLDPTTTTTLRRLLGEERAARTAYDDAVQANEALQPIARNWPLEHRAEIALEAATDRLKTAATNVLPALLDAVEECARLREQQHDTGHVFAAIAAAMSCEPDGDADLVEAVRLLVQERDAAIARAEVAERALLAVHAAAGLPQWDCPVDDFATRLATAVGDLRARVAEEIAADLHRRGIEACLLHQARRPNRRGCSARKGGDAVIMLNWDAECDASRAGLERFMRALVCTCSHFTSSFAPTSVATPSREIVTFRVWIPVGMEQEFLSAAKVDVLAPPVNVQVGMDQFNEPGRKAVWRKP